MTPTPAMTHKQRAARAAEVRELIDRLLAELDELDPLPAPDYWQQLGDRLAAFGRQQTSLVERGVLERGELLLNVRNRLNLIISDLECERDRQLAAEAAQQQPADTPDPAQHPMSMPLAGRYKA